jgi:hypothetical protein
MCICQKEAGFGFESTMVTNKNMPILVAPGAKRT